MSDLTNLALLTAYLDSQTNGISTM